MSVDVSVCYALNSMRDSLGALWWHALSMPRWDFDSRQTLSRQELRANDSKVMKGLT